MPSGVAGKAALLGSVRGLCGSEHLADVCLVVCGHRMPAHRHVLAPHSPVFERMWSSSMSEVHWSPPCHSICTISLGNMASCWLSELLCSGGAAQSGSGERQSLVFHLRGIFPLHYGDKRAGQSQMETAEVTITDLHPATVELLLQYCYGCLHTMPSHHAEVPLSS